MGTIKDYDLAQTREMDLQLCSSLETLKTLRDGALG